jgi:DNA-3-methyladenine glycosylase I
VSEEILHPYCKYALNKEKGNPHRDYHDTEYGFSVVEDSSLFARLILEINQAGLSWNTILLKKNNFYKAYNNFDVARVANYTDEDVSRLMNDKGIVRNKLKINAAIFNANQILSLQDKFGSFKNWLDKHKEYTKAEWVVLFKETFKFTGGEITSEFLMSTGYLQGAHDINCPTHKKTVVTQ